MKNASKNETTVQPSKLPVRVDDEKQENNLALQLENESPVDLIAAEKLDISGYEEISGEYWKPIKGETYQVIFQGFEDVVLEETGEEVECCRFILENGNSVVNASTVMLSAFKKALDKKQPPFHARIFYEKEVQSADPKKKSAYQLFRVWIK